MDINLEEEDTIQLTVLRQASGGDVDMACPHPLPRPRALLTGPLLPGLTGRRSVLWKFWPPLCGTSLKLGGW